MRFYAETGSKYQALKQFEQCRAALLTLGISPERETVQLEQIIKRGEILPQKPVLAGPSAPIASTPRIRQITFKDGVIRSAYFLPDGETIVFSAAWDGEPAELYTMRLDTGEMSKLGIPDAEIYSVSSAGEIAAALHPQPEAYLSRATLARLSLADVTPYEILKNVQFADWHPAKNVEPSLPAEQFLAIVRDRGEKTCLEFPIGNVIFETAGWISHPRFSPDGKRIAFIEHPLNYDDRGFVVLLDFEVKGHKRILTDKSVSILGLAWSNDEIWFTESYQGSARMIKAVNLKGEERPVYRGTGTLTLRDVSKRGEVLVTDDKMRVQTAAGRANEGIERDLSWHDWTLARDLTDDGDIILFEEAGVSGGSELSAYIRKTDGSSVKKIGDGSAIALSPDGKHALLRFLGPHHHLALVPRGEGEIRFLEIDADNPLIYQVFAAFSPDGERIIFSANDINGNNNLYIQSIDGGKPSIFAPDLKIKMLSTHAISPDGKYVALPDSENRLSLYQISNGASSPLKDLEKNFWLIRWAGDGENLFVWRRAGVPAIIYKYNIASGTKEEWLKLSPKDPTGVYQITAIKLTPDGRTYAYSFTRESSDLFLMEDLV
jgi:Tol biopolymer transport system component